MRSIDYRFLGNLRFLQVIIFWHIFAAALLAWYTGMLNLSMECSQLIRNIANIKKKSEKPLKIPSRHLVNSEINWQKASMIKREKKGTVLIFTIELSSQKIYLREPRTIGI